ncbi:prefoldin subunit 5-like [Haliotis rufescens]|uniref:prefoldin subunit 5-like n=1 Tax=Haliotis rufescens TaxID=6454 RepID=UPI001EB0A60C|nr:prefoldin subunit 5-like [Haliotis rufescens]
MAAKSGQTVDLTTLPIQQLNQLSQQLDQEVEFFTNSMNQLKLAQGKFVESQECLNKATPDNLNKDILVPLTSSMYVPGELSDVQNVLVDIGTGYYVEMTIDQGKDYFKRKVEFLTKQIEKIQPIMQEKYRMKQAVLEVIQLKVQAQIAAQQQASTAAKS